MLGRGGRTPFASRAANTSGLRGAAKTAGSMREGCQLLWAMSKDKFCTVDQTGQDIVWSGPTHGTPATCYYLLLLEYYVRQQTCWAAQSQIPVHKCIIQPHLTYSSAGCALPAI